MNKIRKFILALCFMLTAAVPAFAAESADVFFNAFVHYFKTAVIVGIAVGIIVVIVLRANMRTIGKASSASQYMDKESFTLRKRRDIFLYRTESRVKIQENNNNQRGPHNGPGGRR